MGESVEELDSLFDYSRVQPVDIISLDDEDSDTSPVKRQKHSKSSKDAKEVAKVEGVVNLDDEDEEDWLPPPPKFNAKSSKAKLVEGSTLKELRLVKEELISVAKSAKDFLQEVDRSSEKEVTTSENPPVDSASAKSSAPPCERAKIVLSIQDKDGVKQFRIFAEDKFERLFKLYANKTKLSLESLSFSFDGDKISPAATPESLGMEDNDIVEVHAKSNR